MRRQLLAALHHLDDLRRAGKIKHLALTNFDTDTLQLILDDGVAVSSNQVQFSVVDMRPAVRMAPLCVARGVQLLTYGTLLGGLLSEKYVGAPEPTAKADLPTPSQRKYY